MTTTQATTNAAREAGQEILSFERETNTEEMHFKRTINDILKLNPVMRATVAEMIRSRGYDAHVGGHHVAIMDGKVRLGLFTGSSSDFR